MPGEGGEGAVSGYVPPWAFRECPGPSGGAGGALDHGTVIVHSSVRRPCGSHRFEGTHGVPLHHIHTYRQTDIHTYIHVPAPDSFLTGLIGETRVGGLVDDGRIHLIFTSPR